jgi:hypothetical protein
MRILFYLGHPAHYHLFKNIISELLKKNHKVSILIKKKDILEDLLIQSGYEYINILPEGRKDNRIGIAWGLLKRDFSMFKFCLKHHIDIMLGTSTEITHVGKILNIPSIIVQEDDYNEVPLFSKLGYPFAKNILAPISCPTGPINSKWENKTIHYEGFHELAYLHPKRFTPMLSKIVNDIDVSKPFYILRFAKLTAHHDKGKTGITSEISQTIIDLLKPHGNIFITSERELEPQFEKYRINIKTENIHHALFYANMYIGDSQTMAAEAAVLGTPSLRFNDFVRKLGYLNELEDKYGLTYGIKTSEPEKLFKKINEFLKTSNLKQEWQLRREKLLSEKIDVTAFMVWFIENYPNSVQVMKENPEYQWNFK